MNISGFVSSLSSKMPSYESMFKLGFGVMGALSPIFSGMAVKAARSGSYLQSGICAFTALTGPTLMKNLRFACAKVWSSISYARNFSSEILDVSNRVSFLGHRVNALLPISDGVAEPLNERALVGRVDRVLAMTELAVDRAEWMVKNPVETTLLALYAACCYRVLAILALLYGVNELCKIVLNKNNVRQLSEVN